jgi:hypothetical protein
MVIHPENDVLLWGCHVFDTDTPNFGGTVGGNDGTNWQTSSFWTCFRNPFLG